APPRRHLYTLSLHDALPILNGGNRFEYFAPVKIGDEISARGRVADVYEKAGSSGNLLFIIFETDYTNQRGELVARLRGTAIRRRSEEHTSELQSRSDLVCRL